MSNSFRRPGDRQCASLRLVESAPSFPTRTTLLFVSVLLVLMAAGYAATTAASGSGNLPISSDVITTEQQRGGPALFWLGPTFQGADLRVLRHHRGGRLELQYGEKDCHPSDPPPGTTCNWELAVWSGGRRQLAFDPALSRTPWKCWHHVGRAVAFACSRFSFMELWTARTQLSAEGFGSALDLANAVQPFNATARHHGLSRPTPFGCKTVRKAIKAWPALRRGFPRELSPRNCI